MLDFMWFLYVLQHYHQPEKLDNVLNHMNYIFTALFTLEMCVKLVAYKPTVSV